MRGLNGKVAVITGAAGGIGRALVRRFCEEGATVVGLDLNAAGLEELGGQLQEFADRLTLRPLDITDHVAVAVTIRQVHAERGRIDILVNNAGWDVAMQFVETTPEFWDKVIAINLRGPLNLHHAVVPLMIDAGGGKIINIASDAGRVGSSGESVYSACKGGIIAFSKTLARETARKDVRVNVVCPGPTDTALLRSFMGEGEYGQKIYEGLKRAIPLKRLGQPEDIPGIVAFLASDDANFITGQVISVSGGLTMHG
jgi:2-hydroxycyclohexanecarboxyl-CoA dehydrogenase